MQLAKQLRDRLSVWARHGRLDRSIRHILNEPLGSIPRDLFDTAFEAWGDATPVSKDRYFQSALTEAMRAPGPILQCGTSFTTIVLGILCQQTDRHLWTLEHNAHWASVTRSWLEQYEIKNTHVIHAQAEIFDGSVWYMIDRSRLPEDFGLLMCDGCGVLPSGARGSLERIADRLHHRCVILIKDIRRPRDLRYVSQWAKTHQ